MANTTPLSQQEYNALEQERREVQASCGDALRATSGDRFKDVICAVKGNATKADAKRLRGLFTELRNKQGEIETKRSKKAAMPRGVTGRPVSGYERKKKPKTAGAATLRSQPVRPQKAA